MKVLFVLVLVCITSSIFAQSKKDQIAALTLRLDSLSREYIKDTAQLNHTVESLERKNSVLSGQYKSAQEQIKKKSQAIRDKTETIKTVNASNLELMEQLKEVRNELIKLSSNSDIRFQVVINDIEKESPFIKELYIWDQLNNKVFKVGDYWYDGHITYDFSIMHQNGVFSLYTIELADGFRTESKSSFKVEWNNLTQMTELKFGVSEIIKD
jgi:hypothetical protein